MNTPDTTTRNLDLLEAMGTGGCGRGGCGCSGRDASTSDADNESQVTIDQTAQSFAVTGMTCGHCAGAVTSELKAIDGVTDVVVDLIADGTSTVTVTSQAPLDPALVVAALEEAGDYQLA